MTVMFKKSALSSMGQPPSISGKTGALEGVMAPSSSMTQGGISKSSFAPNPAPASQSSFQMPPPPAPEPELPQVEFPNIGTPQVQGNLIGLMEEDLRNYLKKMGHQSVPDNPLTGGDTSLLENLVGRLAKSQMAREEAPMAGEWDADLRKRTPLNIAMDPIKQAAVGFGNAALFGIPGAVHQLATGEPIPPPMTKAGEATGGVASLLGMIGTGGLGAVGKVGVKGFSKIFAAKMVPGTWASKAAAKASVYLNTVGKGALAKASPFAVAGKIVDNLPGIKKIVNVASQRTPVGRFLSHVTRSGTILGTADAIAHHQGTTIGEMMKNKPMQFAQGFGVGAIFPVAGLMELDSVGLPMIGWALRTVVNTAGQELWERILAGGKYDEKTLFETAYQMAMNVVFSHKAHPWASYKGQMTAEAQQFDAEVRQLYGKGGNPPLLGPMTLIGPELQLPERGGGAQITPPPGQGVPSSTGPLPSRVSGSEMQRVGPAFKNDIISYAKLIGRRPTVDEVARAFRVRPEIVSAALSDPKFVEKWGMPPAQEQIIRSEGQEFAGPPVEPEAEMGAVPPLLPEPPPPARTPIPPPAPAVAEAPPPYTEPAPAPQAGTRVVKIEGKAVDSLSQDALTTALKQAKPGARIDIPSDLTATKRGDAALIKNKAGKWGWEKDDTQAFKSESLARHISTEAAPVSEKIKKLAAFQEAPVPARRKPEPQAGPTAAPAPPPAEYAPPTPPAKPSRIEEPQARVERQAAITRQEVRGNPDTIYLFGDNLTRRGLGGQAASMRGEPNAIGIPTKKKPTLGSDAFFTDSEFDKNKAEIDRAFSRIPSGRRVVIPEAGLGTGLAKLEENAPRTFAYLNSKIGELEGRPQAAPQAPVQAEEAPPERAETGLAITKKNVPMWYKVPKQGLRAELREFYPSGTSTARLMADGRRTATTRRPFAKVGDVITVADVPGKWEVIAVEQPDFESLEGRALWERREGWDLDYIESDSKLKAQVFSPAAVQTVVKRVGATTPRAERMEEDLPEAPVGEPSRAPVSQQPSGQLRGGEKLVIAGGRDYSFTDDDVMWLNSIPRPSLVIVGGATGADRDAYNWAKEHNIPTKVIKADWAKWGRKAGPIRNNDMAKIANAVILFPGGAGTESMRKAAKAKKLLVVDRTAGEETFEETRPIEEGEVFHTEPEPRREDSKTFAEIRGTENAPVVGALVKLKDGNTGEVVSIADNRGAFLEGAEVKPGVFAGETKRTKHDVDEFGKEYKSFSYYKRGTVPVTVTVAVDGTEQLDRYDDGTVRKRLGKPELVTYKLDDIESFTVPEAKIVPEPPTPRKGATVYSGAGPKPGELTKRDLSNIQLGSKTADAIDRNQLELMLVEQFDKAPVESTAIVPAEVSASGKPSEITKVSAFEWSYPAGKGQTKLITSEQAAKAIAQRALYSDVLKREFETKTPEREEPARQYQKGHLIFSPGKRGKGIVPFSDMDPTVPWLTKRLASAWEQAAVIVPSELSKTGQEVEFVKGKLGAWSRADRAEGERALSSEEFAKILNDRAKAAGIKPSQWSGKRYRDVEAISDEEMASLTDEDMGGRVTGEDLTRLPYYPEGDTTPDPYRNSPVKITYPEEGAQSISQVAKSASPEKPGKAAPLLNFSWVKDGETKEHRIRASSPTLRENLENAPEQTDVELPAELSTTGKASSLRKTGPDEWTFIPNLAPAHRSWSYSPIIHITSEKLAKHIQSKLGEPGPKPGPGSGTTPAAAPPPSTTRAIAPAPRPPATRAVTTRAPRAPRERKARKSNVKRLDEKDFEPEDKEARNDERALDVRVEDEIQAESKEETKFLLSLRAADGVGISAADFGPAIFEAMGKVKYRRNVRDAPGAVEMHSFQRATTGEDVLQEIAMVAVRRYTKDSASFADADKILRYFEHSVYKRVRFPEREEKMRAISLDQMEEGPSGSRLKVENITMAKDQPWRESRSHQDHLSPGEIFEQRQERIRSGIKEEAPHIAGQRAFFEEMDKLEPGDRALMRRRIVGDVSFATLAREFKRGEETLRNRIHKIGKEIIAARPEAEGWWKKGKPDTVVDLNDPIEVKRNNEEGPEVDTFYSGVPFNTDAAEYHVRNLWKKAKAFWVRYGTTAKGMPEKAFEYWGWMNNQQRAHTFMSAAHASLVHKWLRSIERNPLMRENLHMVLSGEVPATNMGIPDAVVRVINEWKANRKSLSEAIGDSNELPQDFKDWLLENSDSYLTRVFRINEYRHRRGLFSRKVFEPGREAREKMKEMLKRVDPKNFTGPHVKEQDLDNYLDAWLEGVPYKDSKPGGEHRQKSLGNLFKGRKLWGGGEVIDAFAPRESDHASVDANILLDRKARIRKAAKDAIFGKISPEKVPFEDMGDLSPEMIKEYREKLKLASDYRDAYEDFGGLVGAEGLEYLMVKTATKQATMAFHGKFFQDIRDNYKEILWTDNPVSGWKEMPLGGDTMRWGVLANHEKIWVSPEFNTFLKYDFTPRVADITKFVERAIVNPWKKAHVLYSWPTLMHNLVGGTMFSVLARTSFWNPANLPSYFDSAKTLIEKMKADGIENWAKVLGVGVTDTTFHGEEIPRGIKDFLSLDSNPLVNKVMAIPRRAEALFGGFMTGTDQLFRISAYYNLTENLGYTPREAVAFINKSMPNYLHLPAAVEFLRRVPIFGPLVSFQANALKIMTTQTLDGLAKIQHGMGYGKMTREPGTFLGKEVGEAGSRLHTEEVERPGGGVDIKAFRERVSNPTMVGAGINQLLRVGLLAGGLEILRDTIMKVTGISKEEVKTLESMMPDYMQGREALYFKDKGKLFSMDFSYINPFGDIKAVIKNALAGNVNGMVERLNVMESPVLGIWNLITGIDPKTRERVDPEARPLRLAQHALKEIYMPQSLPIFASETYRQFLKTGKFEPREGAATTQQIKGLIDAYYGDSKAFEDMGDAAFSFATGLRKAVFSPEDIYKSSQATIRAKLNILSQHYSRWKKNNAGAPAWDAEDKRKDYLEDKAKLIEEYENNQRKWDSITTLK